MKVYGITGLIGSGKSETIKYISSLGYPVIDADDVSRIVVDKNTDEGRVGFEKIYKAFGSEVLNPQGGLDRSKLLKRIMTAPHERQMLEAIMHPMIVEHILGIMRKWKEADVSLGFIEGTRIVEAGLHKYIAKLILVTTNMDIRIKRIAKRDHMDKYEVQQMLGMQDEGLMRVHSKEVFVNDKKLSDLHKQIDAFVEKHLSDG